ncbi:hypothetical protein G7Y89_g15730 [Cudoniella acicularis]|uniref:Uncharacterized protein n=1 Tax=Cudoniella acicularis TaxID=354080 RepID=A0A8H4QG70_9HELO|nr:hypothetical protein G7Y89_g15730 [Cudoniella acicularis]
MLGVNVPRFEESLRLAARHRNWRGGHRIRDEEWSKTAKLPALRLMAPGRRPQAPPEGAAQQYTRVGNRDQQRLFTFENGTCFEYGPLDPVDQFDLARHPFCNQVALINKAIKFTTIPHKYDNAIQISGAEGCGGYASGFQKVEEWPNWEES